MPPNRLSRYAFTAAFDRGGKFQLTDREPFLFRHLPDNRIHTVTQGDSLFSLAASSYRGMPRPAGLWWVIADFQPDPIIDPTIRLASGRVLFIPSMRTLVEDIFEPDRRREARQ